MVAFKHVFKNIRRFTSLIYIAIAISFLCIGVTACSSESSSSPLDDLNSVEASKEFKYNYELLYFYYNDAKKYLEAPENYIGKIKDNALAEYSIPWDYYDIYFMYNQMNDPYTQYVDPSRSLAVMQSISSSKPRMDPGFEYDISGTTNDFYITSVIKNSPADKAGLKVGDQITAIEGVAPISEVVIDRLSTATEGDVVIYTVKRDSQTLTLPVVLTTYYPPTVELSFKDSIPIIKILEFTKTTSSDSGTYGEFVNYLHETEKYKATIIDLRNNGGGDGDQCIPMAQLLLSKGDTTVGVISTDADTIHMKQTYDTTFTTNKFDGFAKDRYYVFLVNGKSASCSELFLLSVTMNKKYPVVGTTTYGKGIGQLTIPTPSFSLAIITSLKVIDKNFKTYHNYGIEPDFVIHDEEQALNKAVELAKGMTYIRTAEYGSVNTGHFAKMAAEQDSMPGFYFLPEEYRKKF